MGITTACGLAREKTAIGALILLTCLAIRKTMVRMGKKKNPNAQALGRLGGKARAKNLSDAEITKIASKGGTARAAKLSAAERSRIAKLAAAARESKRKESN
jgi:hypothetical protein